MQEPSLQANGLQWWPQRKRGGGERERDCCIVRSIALTLVRCAYNSTRTRRMLRSQCILLRKYCAHIARTYRTTTSHSRRTNTRGDHRNENRSCRNSCDHCRRTRSRSITAPTQPDHFQPRTNGTITILITDQNGKWIAQSGAEMRREK